MHAIHRNALSLGLITLLGLPALALAASHPPHPAQKPASKPEQKPAPKPEAPKHAAIGDEVDAGLSVTDVDGKGHTLRDYRGKTLVVAMWSIDSPACKSYVAKLKKLNDDNASKGVVVIAVDPNATEVDAGAEPYKRIKDYAGKNAVGAALMVDAGGKFAEKLGATATPEIFVIDGKGILRYKGAIDDDPKGEKGDKANALASKAVEEVLAGKPVTTSTSPANGTPIQHGAPPKPEEKPAPPKKPEEKPAPKKPSDKPAPPKKGG